MVLISCHMETLCGIDIMSHGNTVVLISSHMEHCVVLISCHMETLCGIDIMSHGNTVWY